MKGSIRPIIEAVTPLSKPSIEKIEELATFVQLKKGAIISAVGQSNQLGYFVIEGICKSFLSTPEGEDVTISFFMPGSIVSPSTTRIQAGKSVLNIRALTDMLMATMDAEAFEDLMVNDLEIRNFGNAVLRNELMEKVQKEIAMASMKGKDRLQLLRKKFPNIENLVPHADIASYLGITTISLSRLRTQS